jgi:hypothetical protein
LRRVDREGREVVFIGNQNTGGGTREFSLLIPGATGAPEVWDPMRGGIESVAWRQESRGVSCQLSLAPLESVLLRFGGADSRPPRLTAVSAAAAVIPVTADPAAKPIVYPVPEHGQKSPCAGTAWQGVLRMPADALAPGRRAVLVCEMPADVAEDAAAVRINGRHAGGFIGAPYRVELTGQLKAGDNTVVVEPFPVTAVRLEIH